MSATDVEYRPEAADRLESYLRQVRAALAGAPGVSADEVEGDIREHVAAEFRAAPGPVGPAALEEVLARLGPPAAWRPAGGAPAAEPWDWRGAFAGLKRRLLGAAETLWRGPDDWRLAYLAFGLTALGVLSAGLLLPFAYLVARAAVALAAERRAPLGAKRWLVYPPLVAVSVPLLLVPLACPVLLGPLAYWQLIEPAELYGDTVGRVHPSGVIEFRKESRYVLEVRERIAPNQFATYLSCQRSHRYGASTIDGRVFRIGREDQWWSEATLRVLVRVPGADAVRGPLLAAFVAAGGLFTGWLLLGLMLRWAPAEGAGIFFPLIGDATGFGRRLVTVGAVGMIWWGAAGWALAEAPPRNAPDAPAAAAW